ncbi:hypothetical protein [Acidovorax sp. LjRoot129]|uniref:hypothetical protein n=1 Tax=Acidovorax sp. LjRoot129 TaxID=3342260 RepID=UPI003F50352D
MLAMQDMVKTMRGIAPWPVMRAFLKRSGLPVARGWDEVIEKFNELPALERTRAEASVEKFLTDYHLHGEKWVTFLEVPEHFRDRLSTYLGSLQPENGQATSDFPLRMADDFLMTEEQDILQLVKVTTQGDVVSLIFSGIAAAERKDTIYPDQFVTSGIPPAFTGYEEIVLIRRQASQYFPVIVFDKAQGLVQALVPSLGNMSAEDVLLTNLTRKINELLVAEFQLDLQLLRNHNLFPAIHNIYMEPTEGTVVELGFQTETGSAKLERMKEHDLRQEPFHVKGKAAVFNTLLEFRLTVRWELNGHNVELMLPGTTRTIAKSPPYALYRARITGTVDQAEFGHCIAKLLDYS